MSVVPGGTDFSLRSPRSPLALPGPARSLTLWFPMLGTFGPLQSWFPAVTACSLGTSSPQRLPPFSGHRTSELRAELRGRGLGVSHAPSTPSLYRAPLHPLGRTSPASDTPLRLLSRSALSLSVSVPRQESHAPDAPLCLALPRSNASCLYSTRGSRERPRPSTPPRPAPSNFQCTSQTLGYL